MKIAVTGKGGVGKTTFAATLARLYADEGKHVLAADVDPDANLGLALGFSEKSWKRSCRLRRCASWLKKEQEQVPVISSIKSTRRLTIFRTPIPESATGVKLLVLGTVDTANSGCVCPEHVMLKRIINHLVLRSNDVVILDMEAGLEHLGRGTTEGMDQFVVVIEPGARSIQTYKNVKRLAAGLGVKKVRVVANKGQERGG